MKKTNNNNLKNGDDKNINNYEFQKNILLRKMELELTRYSLEHKLGLINDDLNKISLVTAKAQVKVDGSKKVLNDLIAKTIKLEPTPIVETNQVLRVDAKLDLKIEKLNARVSNFLKLTDSTDQGFFVVAQVEDLLQLYINVFSYRSKLELAKQKNNLINILDTQDEAKIYQNCTQMYTYINQTVKLAVNYQKKYEMIKQDYVECISRKSLDDLQSKALKDWLNKHQLQPCCIKLTSYFNKNNININMINIDNLFDTCIKEIGQIHQSEEYESQKILDDIQRCQHARTILSTVLNIYKDCVNNIKKIPTPHKQQLLESKSEFEKNYANLTPTMGIVKDEAENSDPDQKINKSIQQICGSIVAKFYEVAVRYKKQSISLYDEKKKEIDMEQLIEDYQGHDVNCYGKMGES